MLLLRWEDGKKGWFRMDSQELDFGHVKLEMTSRQPRDINSRFGYMTWRLGENVRLEI